MSRHTIIEINCVRETSAAEIRSSGRQMRPMNPRDYPRSYHSLVTNGFFRFCSKCFGMKVVRRFHRCTNIKCPLCLSKLPTPFGPFYHFFIGCMVSADHWLADYPELRRTTQPSVVPDKALSFVVAYGIKSHKLLWSMTLLTKICNEIIHDIACQPTAEGHGYVHTGNIKSIL